MEDVLKPTLIKKFSTTTTSLSPTSSGEVTIVQLAAGWEHSLALTQTGRVYSWGCGYKDSRRGVVPPVLGLGHSECRPAPEPLTSIEAITIAAIASGWDHCLAMDQEGKLLSWGSGQNGKLGHGNEENISVPCYLSALEEVRIETFCAGCEHSAAITVDGVLYTWGHGDGGRLGQGGNSPQLSPRPVQAMREMNLR